jgi:F-type H+-transporting ATPase subunit gamma
VLNEEALRKRIATAEELHSVVRTMKALASSRVRRFKEAADSLEVYNSVVEMGFRIIMRAGAERIRTAGKPGRRGAVVFGSDQGLAGPFNDRIVRHALAEIDRSELPRKDWTVLCVGLRAASRLESAGQAPVSRFSMPRSVEGIAPRVQDIIVILEKWHFEEEIERIYLFFNRHGNHAHYAPETFLILPVSPDFLDEMESKPWPGRTLPQFSLSWDRLFSLLVRQYIFVNLYRALVESLASENAGRLASMQGAEKNIENRMEELAGEMRRVRQDAITEELLDIVSGYETIREEKN